MTLALSRRNDTVSQAEIRAMSQECQKVGGINLAQGVCDTPPPPLVLEAAARAMRDGCNSYTRCDGLRELREAVAFKLARDQGLQVDPETQVVISAGSTGAFYCACLALLEEGDEVMLFQPFYGYHHSTLAALGAVPVPVPLAAPHWAFTREDLERTVSHRTRALMVCTPGNPSGKVFSRAELEIIQAFAEAHDLFVFTDEIYEYFTYGADSHLSPAALPGLAERTLLLGGYSKTFSITGWRIGYCVAQARWAQAISHMNDLVYVCAPAPLQMGVAEGILHLPPAFYRNLAEDYRRKRDQICAVLAAAGLAPLVPDGAYYVLADIRSLGADSAKAAAMAILRQAGVASVPGGSFFADADQDRFVRFCFAKRQEELDAACAALGRLSVPGRP